MNAFRAWKTITGPRLVIYHLEDAVIQCVTSSLPAAWRALLRTGQALLWHHSCSVALVHGLVCSAVYRCGLSRRRGVLRCAPVRSVAVCCAVALRCVGGLLFIGCFQGCRSQLSRLSRPSYPTTTTTHTHTHTINTTSTATDTAAATTTHHRHHYTTTTATATATTTTATATTTTTTTTTPPPPLHHQVRKGVAALRAGEGRVPRRHATTR